MKSLLTPSSCPVDILKTPSSVKITALALFSLTLLLFLFTRYSNSPTATNVTFFLPPSFSQPPPPHGEAKVFRLPPLPSVERMGVIDENGVMTDNFTVGDLDLGDADMKNLLNLLNWNNTNDDSPGELRKPPPVKKFKVCDSGILVDYIPCFDNAEDKKNYERHCPKQPNTLNCILPKPRGYRRPILWPQSRDQVPTLH